MGTLLRNDLAERACERITNQRAAVSQS